MAGAFEDDDRLDSLEAQMNDYAHVPDRWRMGAAAGRSRVDYDVGADELLKMDPRHMDNEEYAEWIRAGMYRYVRSSQSVCNIHAKAAKAGTARLAKLAEEERKRKKLEKEIRWLLANCPPPVSLDDLTVDAIAAFLVPPSLSANVETEKKHRKDKLRETFLRFHPDKFEGRLMSRRVRDAIGVVVRALNALTGGV
ncbi:hypothetical protein B0H14DRAFT_2923445 [Mycena olivaceomarginata]|nr:hypothetical protein B0H14DRAFT_2923445 [Mycena olivaceomarginata]